MLTYQSKQEIRLYIASKMKEVSRLSKHEIEEELAHCDQIIEYHVPLKLGTFSRHITNAQSTRHIQSTLERFNLEVSLKVAVLRYRERLERERSERNQAK